jgi:hypothetical protein
MEKNAELYRRLSESLPLRTKSRFAQSHWPVGLAGLLEFLHMAAEGWTEGGDKNGLTMGRDVAFDLLDRFLQLLDQPLA